jgi:predicted MPP superfamily phosphohydrolase
MRMSVASALSSPASRVLERLRVGFFRIFFPLLLAAIAASEWVVLARVATRLGVAPHPVLHLLGPVSFYAVNRWLARRLRAGGRGTLVSTYVAFAFTAVFCGAFVGIAELVWAVARLGTLPAVRAGLVPVAGVARWDQAFEAVVDLGLAGIGGLFLYGYTVGRRALEITSRRVAIRGLPPAFAGFRIVHVSDLHVGRFLGPDELRRHVERVNALDPDLICITGDLVDRAETCASGFPVLAALRARHGVVVTLGNHDFAAGADAVTAALHRHTPFTVLRNAVTDVAIDGARFAVVGVDDLGRDWARGVLEHPALPPLVRRLPQGLPFIVLSHRPDCFAQAAELGASLVLSGHTHGGQLALPPLLGRRVRNLAEFITRYDRGVFERGDATLVVSNGLGFTGQRVRLFTPREIGCIELWPA